MIIYADFDPFGLSMAKNRRSGKLAVILHADVAGSTGLVRQDEQVAHERIQDSFGRFNDVIEKYRGRMLELKRPGNSGAAPIEHLTGLG